MGRKKKIVKGGKRPGAGRPPDHPSGATKPVGVTLQPDILDALDAFAADNGYISRSKAINILLRRISITKRPSPAKFA